MPHYEYDKDYPFAAFITNLGKYNEGELVGEWVKFPTTAKELQKVFERIGIGQKDDFGQVYEEWFITDYDCFVDGLYDKLGEYENLDELNYLASKLDEMSQGEYEQFQAAMEIGDHSGSLQEIINLTENLDCYDIYPDIHDHDDLGRYYIEELDAMQVPEHLRNYIDYEAYGRDVALEEGGEFTDYGYVRDSGNRFDEVYDGDRDSIPEEYRVMTFQDAEELTEDEISEWAMDIAFDMDEFFRQRDPQYAAEHPEAHAAKEEIYENLSDCRIASLEEKLKALGQTPEDYLPSELEKFKEAVGYEEFLDVDPAVIREAIQNPDKSHVDEMLAFAEQAGRAYEAELSGKIPEGMRAGVTELAGDIDLFFRQYNMEYTAMFPDDVVQRRVLQEHLERGETSAIKTGLINVGREKDLTEETAPMVSRLDTYEKELGLSTYMVYQLQGGDKTLDLRFEPLDSIRAMGHTVDAANYELIYAAPFKSGESLETIYRDLNLYRPDDFRGHSLSVSDVVVIRENGRDTAHYCDRLGFAQVPEFLGEKQKELTPADRETGETVRTPRGTFYVTDMSREQMEAAGYGLHHQSEDGRHLIMTNGSQAFAIRAEQAPEQENPLRTAEMTLEDDYGMIDGIINNSRRGEELDKAKDEARRIAPEKKPSIRERLEEAKKECGERRLPDKSHQKKPPEHDL